MIVISSYPEKNVVHSAHTVGVASYTKNLLTAMSQAAPDTPILVLAEQLEGVAETEYQEGQITVKRCWQRGRARSFKTLYQELKKTTAPDVLVSFEINMFGSRRDTVAALWQIRRAKKHLGKKVTLIMHQVVGNFGDLEKSGLKTKVLNLAARIFYRLIKSASQQIIVFEQRLKDNLLGAGGRGGERIQVVPHYISPEPILDQAQARTELGWSPTEIYVLYFGYLAPYKGILDLLKIWPETAPVIAGRPVKLIVGGGINPNHQTKKEIVAYVQQVEQEAEKRGVTVTGFIPAEKLPVYLSACDLMIFPYRSFLSSSGPLAFAFSYGKLPLLAEPLAAYGESQDVSENLAAQGLAMTDLIFALNTESLTQALERAWEKRAALVAFDQAMMTSRALASVAERTWAVIEPQKEPA
jgi:glycosyltransferase involved in cell wall biosynthesis